MTSTPSTLLLGALLCSLAAPALTQSSVPVQAKAEVDTAALATTGRANLRLRFTSETTLKAPLAIRV